MRKLMLTSILLVAIFSIQAQTLNHIADSLMIKSSYPDNKLRLDTDYGSLVFNAKSLNSMVNKVVITISNDNIFYDSIMNTETMAITKIGSRWTDFIFNYKYVGHKKFKSLEAAQEYYNELMDSPYFNFKKASIWKHNEKEKYFVGLIRKDEGTYFLVDDKEGTCGIANKFHKISK
ncbi:MAG: hypothetical protein GXO88_08530 [Chlorobi bacterium]|nr:hypothetical protein [Chlorobiota bacterium]